MPRTSVALLGAAAVAALTLTACSGSSADSGANAADSSLPVINSGTLTVCISKNAYEPLYWKDGDTLTGFDPDSITAIADELGLDVQYNESAFDGLLPALMSGRCDVLRSGLYINEERSASADAIPYLRTGPALIIPEGNPLGLETTDDLSGIRIAVQGASANEAILQELNAQFEEAGRPLIELSIYPELPETVAALQNGRVDATMETDVAAVQAAETLGDGFGVAEEIFPAETNFGMYLPQGSELTPRIIEVAQKLTDDGTFASIAEEYGLLPSRIVAPS